MIGPPPEARAPAIDRPCLQLRLFAQAVCAQDPPRLSYLDFWRGFPAHDDGSSIRTMFRALFGGIGLRKPVVIRSVFPHHHPPADGVAWEGDRVVRVAFSGEAHHLDVRIHDLNLIMAPDDPTTNVVAYVNLAANAHEAGLWPLLSAPRPVRPGRKFCVAVISNVDGEVRARFIHRLDQRKPIDSCGRSMNNVGFLAPADERDFGDAYLPFLQRYKFMVCFENTKASHYLTEKLANAYAAGCIPVYWGAPEACAWFNPGAFLCLEDESDDGMDALIDRMLEIDRDERAYRELFAQPLLPAGIPEMMRLETLRAKIASTLRRSRPDAFL